MKIFLAASFACAFVFLCGENAKSAQPSVEPFQEIDDNLRERVSLAGELSDLFENLKATEAEHADLLENISEQLKAIAGTYSIWGEAQAGLVDSAGPRWEQLKGSAAIESALEHLPNILPSADVEAPLAVKEAEILRTVANAFGSCVLSIETIVAAQKRVSWAFDLDDPRAAKLNTTLRALNERTYGSCSAIADVGDTLMNLSYSRYQTRSNVVRFWRKTLHAQLGEANLDDASIVLDRVSSTEPTWRVLTDIAHRISYWKKRRIYLLRTLRIPRSAIRAALAFTAEVQQMRHNTTQIYLHPEIAPEIEGAIADAEDLASTFVTEATDRLQTMDDDDYAFRASWASYWRRRGARSLRCESLGDASKGPNSIDAEEAFIELWESCQ